jgi:cysteine-rich repeat protein
MHVTLPRGATVLLVCASMSCDADFSIEGEAHATDTADDGECPIGSEGCGCTAGGSCDPGLACVSFVCLDVPDGPQCGNAIVEEGEECDYGDDNAPGALCRPDCHFNVCGDNDAGPDEECDLGAMNADTGPCKLDCTAQACGDGFVGPGEACDDGDVIAGDGCSPSCVSETCGNAIVDAGEQCDDGPANADDAACKSNCTLQICGDGFVGPGEACDDGVNDGGYAGCAVGCGALGPHCGDGLLSMPDEQCDDANTTPADGCSDACDSSGGVVWSAVHTSAGNNPDRLAAIAVGPTGDVYATGHQNVAGQGRNVLVLRFSPAGALVWGQTIDSAGADDYGHAIAVSSTGDAFVAGQVRSGANRDLWSARIGHDGAVGWQRVVDGSGSDVNDSAFGIALDEVLDRVYVVGTLDSPANGQDAAVAIYALDGTPVGNSTFTSAGAVNDVLNDVEVMDDGDVVVAGSLGQGGSGLDTFLQRTDPGFGAVQWTQTYAGPSGADAIRSVVTDGEIIYVAGSENVAGQAANVWVRRYTGGGAFVWTRSFNGTDNAADVANGIALDPTTGDVVVAGQVASGGAHAWARRIDADGATIWTSDHAPTSFGGVALDAAGALFVVGHQTGTGEDGWYARLVP